MWLYSSQNKSVRNLKTMLRRPLPVNNEIENVATHDAAMAKYVLTTARSCASPEAVAELNEGFYIRVVKSFSPKDQEEWMSFLLLLIYQNYLPNRATKRLYL